MWLKLPHGSFLEISAIDRDNNRYSRRLRNILTLPFISRPPLWLLMHGRFGAWRPSLGGVLRVFRSLIVADVVTVFRLLPHKQGNLDPLPTRLFKDNVDVLVSFLVMLFNQSLTLGVV